MDCPFNHHSKSRPTLFPVPVWRIVFLILIFGSLELILAVVADSSPPVADVEDLFKDEGFLRMSRGGEAFGRRPPPPPLILNPPHLSTQPPPRQFPTPLPFPKEKGIRATIPPSQRNDQISSSGEKGSLENVNSNLANRSHNRNRGTKSDVDKVGSDEGGGNGGLKPTGPDANGHQSSRGLEKDVNGVFSKVSPAVGGGGTSGSSSSSGGGDPGAESDAHPLLGITPAAPGEAFDFNPILSNPAVTRILAGSSGRIPQWEPALPDLHDIIPDVNYTTDVLGNRGYPHGQNPSQHQSASVGDNLNSASTPGGNPGNNLSGSSSNSGSSNSNNNLSGNTGHGAVFNPKNPVFVPSPVSSKGSSTMYNMDQLTNNIAIPKHTLPNPSNLATSRSTVLDDGSESSSGSGSNINNNYGGNSQGSSGVNNGGIGGSTFVDDLDRENGGGNSHHDRYPPTSGSVGSSNHLDGSRGEGGGPYFYDEDESGLSEDSARSHVAANPGDVQGKRGIWKETGSGHAGQESLDSRDENGPKYIVCDALCGAWKHQCKLMGILFSITSVLCLLFAVAILYSLQFSIRDFVPFSVILLLLFATSASRAFILLSGWLCSPDSRPTWLPIVSTLPAALFVITILVALHLARFPFPFIKSYTIPCYTILIISSVALGPPLFLSLGAHFHPHNHGVLSQVAWIFGHVVLALMSLAYLLKFKPFYVRLANERGNANGPGGISNSSLNGGGTLSSSGGTPAVVANGGNLSSLKKRGYVVKWGCLQARAMFGASLLALCLSTMIIISVAMGRGECEGTSTWTGWVLSLCARMLEFAIVILLLLVTISSADIRFIRLTRVPINKSNVGLINGDIFPTMVSSTTAVQRCIPMYSSNARADVMMLGPTESRSSLRGKTFGERALPGERLGEYRSSVGRGLPLRLGSGGPSHSLPGTPVDGFPQGLKLPEPAPASLLVTKVVFGTPAKSREVNLSHQHENPLLCTGGGGPGSKDDRETNNIYASLESVKIAPFVNAGSSTGSNHSGSDRVLLSAPRDYIYSISRDLTKTIDSIYDTSRPRGNNLAHTIETLCPPLAHTIEQIGSIPNLSGNLPGRGGSTASGAGLPFNLHPHNMHPYSPHGNGMTGGRTDLARTIDRIRYAAAAAGPPSASGPLVTQGNNQAGRNFVLQLGTGSSHLPGINPPPYCSSESSHDVTPDSGIVCDIHSKNGREVPEVVYARDYRGNSVEDVRRLPILPLPKQPQPQHRTPGTTPLYDRTPTSPNNPSSSSPAALRPGASPLYVPTSSSSNNAVVGCVEHLLNQTEHILSRTESLDNNSHSAGLQRLLNHKEQLEHVEKLLAQAEYAIWLEKRNCAQQVSHQLNSNESPSPYGYSHRTISNVNSAASASFSSTNSANPVQSSMSMRKDAPNSLHIGSNGNPMVVSNHLSSIPSGGPSSASQSSKKISKNLEEESVV